MGVKMIAKIAAASILLALVFWGGPAAADDCRKVNLDDQQPSAPIGVQPKLKNLGPGEVYISLASAPVKDLSADPNDMYRVTDFVLGPGGAVGPGSGHIVTSIDNKAYVVQLAKRAVAATVEICAQP
jgi:hypothetical protein